MQQQEPSKAAVVRIFWPCVQLNPQHASLCLHGFRTQNGDLIITHVSTKDQPVAAAGQAATELGIWWPDRSQTSGASTDQRQLTCWGVVTLIAGGFRLRQAVLPKQLSLQAVFCGATLLQVRCCNAWPAGTEHA